MRDPELVFSELTGTAYIARLSDMISKDGVRFRLAKGKKYEVPREVVFAIADKMKKWMRRDAERRRSEQVE